MTVASISSKMKGIAVITCIFLLQQHTRLHAAPSIESCPHDSVQVEDTCKCDPKLCVKPPCQYELNISINGTDTPGSCCAIYTCDGCTNDTLIHGKCPCAPDAILNSEGKCKCVDRYKSLVNNECVCDPDLCELPQICAPNYVSVTEHDGCCSRNKCIKCPEDSFPTNNNDDAVEDKCVCYPCTNECGPNEKVVIMQHGNNLPGTCCDMYKCEKDDTEAKCAVEGVVYGDGEIWETPDAQTCKCQGGISFCLKQDEENSHSCHKEGRVYKHMESWMLDSCTNCTCFNGETKCISHMCEVSEGHLKKPECQPLNCSKACPDGYKLNKRGCKICKCNYPYKYEDILQKYNITKDKLKEILDDYFAQAVNESTSSAPASTTSTNVSDEYQVNTPFSQSDGCKPLSALIWSVVGFSISIILALIIYVIRKLSHRNKGSYDTNPARSTTYERMNLTKGALFNNNYIGNDSKNKNNIKGSV